MPCSRPIRRRRNYATGRSAPKEYANFWCIAAMQLWQSRLRCFSQPTIRKRNSLRPARSRRVLRRWTESYRPCAVIRVCVSPICRRTSTTIPLHINPLGCSNITTERISRFTASAWRMRRRVQSGSACAARSNITSRSVGCPTATSPDALRIAKSTSPSISPAIRLGPTRGHCGFVQPRLPPITWVIPER